MRFYYTTVKQENAENSGYQAIFRIKVRTYGPFFPNKIRLLQTFSNEI